MSFNLMAAVTICSDFEAQENKKKMSVTVSIVSSSICHEVMGPASKKTFSFPYIEINFPDEVFLAENAHFQHLEYVIPLSPDL